MKTVLVIALVLTVANCVNFNELASSFERQANLRAGFSKSNKRDDNFICVPVSCTRTGGSCSLEVKPTEVCDECITEFYSCNSNQCDCGIEAINCFATNASDPFNCNPTYYYQFCKNNLPDCACGSFTGKVPLPICNFDAYCNHDTEECTRRPGLGGACTNDNDCGAPFDHIVYDCENERCVKAKYSSFIGDSCVANEDCAGNQVNEVNCTNGICVGLSLGQSCTASPFCNYGLYCNDSVCEPLLADGASCDQNNDGCGHKSICGYGDKCVPVLSVANGGNCEHSVECRSGSTCVNNKCASNPTRKACNGDSDCPTSEGYDGTCDCGVDGNGYCSVTTALFAQCGSSLLSAIECGMGARCQGPLGSECYVRNCANALNCAYSCSNTFEAIPSTCLSNPPVCQSDTTTTEGNSAMSNAVSMGLAAIAISATML